MQIGYGRHKVRVIKGNVGHLWSKAVLYLYLLDAECTDRGLTSCQKSEQGYQHWRDTDQP